jgi:hypothetical protein
MHERCWEIYRTHCYVYSSGGATPLRWLLANPLPQGFQGQPSLRRGGGLESMATGCRVGLGYISTGAIGLTAAGARSRVQQAVAGCAEHGQQPRLQHTGSQHCPHR